MKRNKYAVVRSFEQFIALPHCYRTVQ